MDHAPAHLVGLTQQARGAIQVPFQQGLANQGAADPFAADQHRCRIRHFKAMTGAVGFEQVEIAGAPLAEAEIVADDQVTHAERPDQNILDEAFRRLIGQRPVEAQDQGMVHRQFRQPVHFFAQPHEPGRGIDGVKKLAGLWLEQDDADREVQPPAFGGQPLDHGPVAEVHAIKIADGHDAPLRRQMR